MEALNAKGCEVLALVVVKLAGCCEAEAECWVISPIDCEFKKAKIYSHCDLEIGHCGVEKTDSSPVWVGLIVPNPAIWLQET